MRYSVKDSQIVLIYSHIDAATSALAQQNLQNVLSQGLLSSQTETYLPRMWKIQEGEQTKVLGVKEIFLDEAFESVLVEDIANIGDIEYVWTREKESAKSNFWTGSNNQSLYSPFAQLADLVDPNAHVQAFNFERAPDVRLGPDPWSFEDNQNRFTQPHWPAPDTLYLRPTEPLELSFEPTRMSGLGLVQWMRRDEEQGTQRISVEQVAERAMEEGHVHQVLENLSIPVPVPQSRAARRLQRRLDNRG